MELYGTQRELAKIQESIQGYHAAYLEAQKQRVEAEQRLQAQKSELAKKQEILEQEKKQAIEYQKEIDKLNATLSQVAANQSELASNISVQKREAYKLEEDKAKLAKNKQDQVRLIVGVSSGVAHVASGLVDRQTE